MSCSTSEQPADNTKVFDGVLGPVFSSDKILLTIWSPHAEAAKLNIYNDGNGGETLETLAMKKGEGGTWVSVLNREYENKYYTVQVKIGGNWSKERPDLYARAAGVNGMRAMFVDLNKTNPKGWEQDRRPALESFSEIILYELHVRDATIHPSAGVEHPGKYLGLVESAISTNAGIGHIKEMGVTHVHLLPVFDHNSIDETKHMEPHYNWGYDPLHYNLPEGSFSTDPYDGRVRIREFKQMVKAFHDNNLRVVMDVVYNHTAIAPEHGFSQIAPGYFYRFDSQGDFSDASACGNETASEKEMMRKFIVESVLYWAQEYHIDGFRFDLMGIHDQVTMNAVTEALHNYDPSIFIYGEGWKAGESPIEDEKLALKKFTYKMPGLAAFSDDIRDGIKGSVFEESDKGYVSGKSEARESVKFGIVGATKHPQVNYEAVDYSDEPWAGSPLQSINYVSCHDNHTLYDKLKLSCEDCSEEEIIQMHKLANGIVLTSQGIPFLHAGVEFLRSKGGEENSFESPDSINNIVWSDKERHAEHVEFYKHLIALRKSHPGIRMSTTDEVSKNLSFIDDEGVLGFIVESGAVGDEWQRILVIYNVKSTPAKLSFVEGTWRVAYTEERGFNPADQEDNRLEVIGPLSMGIFYQ